MIHIEKNGRNVFNVSMRITCFIPQQKKSFTVVAKCHHGVQRVPVHFTKAGLFENKTGGNFSRDFHFRVFYNICEPGTGFTKVSRAIQLGLPVEHLKSKFCLHN